MDTQKKEAAVIGGSNGIGLSICNELLERGYHVHILDKNKPDPSLLASEKDCSYCYCDLMELDEEMLGEMSKNANLNVVMITAGIGWVANFEYLHTAEINKLMTIDAVSTLKIMRLFYDRIKSQEPFHVGVMGSIAGLVSSPMFSVYAAAKAAVCRFVESVNIELEEEGTTNRILNVAPGSIKGTKFNGGNNDLSQMKELSTQIVERLLRSETLYIPDYEEIYKGVIERYHADAHEYGLHSYEYKQTSGRMCSSRVRIGYLSGTFDLFHVGHLNLLKRAKAQCDYLIVGVHGSGAWKGKETFIPLEERKQIVAACKYVDKVVDSCRDDSDAWALWHYHKLFVGSDYKGTERFNRYEEYFKDKDVEIVYFPYTTSTSSTQIRNAVEKKAENT